MNLKQLPLIYFEALDDGLNLLKKHLSADKKIVCHADVDIDGNQSMYILKRFLDSKLKGLSAEVIYTTNLGKYHGITTDFVDKVNSGIIINCWETTALDYIQLNKKIDLVIITDSSSSELELIKALNTDVLVLDHHDMENIPILGETAGGKYVIINPKSVESGLKNQEVRTRNDCFSAGLVVYEFLRHLENSLMVDLMLYQNAVMTLYSDGIPILLENSKIYVKETLMAAKLEPQMYTLLNSANCFHKQLTKNNMLYNINPLINKAIYYNKNYEVLDILLNNPGRLGGLKKYREEMDKIVDDAMGEEKTFGNHIVYMIKDSYEFEDESKYNLIRNLKGMIASRLANNYYRLALVGVIKDGKAYLSFRGDGDNKNYRALAREYLSDKFEAFAEGHKTSFGIEVMKEDLGGLLNHLEKSRSYYEKNQNGLSLGENSYTFGTSLMNKFNAKSLESLSQETGLSVIDLIYQMGDYNARNTSDMEKTVYMDLNDPSNMLVYQGSRGKVYQYQWFGIRAVAFKSLDPKYLVSAYIEQGVGLQIVLRQTNYLL